MEGTRDRILVTALHLFARDGYEAVSVSKIAGELGMTKGALYRHYKSKRDIFDSIFERICELDEERARRARVPEGDFDEMPSSFGGTSIDGLVTYLEEQFAYWSEDEMARDFRRMLTLEQHRSAEMTELFHKVMTRGPISYLEDLMREMMARGAWREADPRQMAIELHAPFHLLLCLTDSARDASERREMARAYGEQVRRFVRRYAARPDEGAGRPEARAGSDT